MDENSIHEFAKSRFSDPELEKAVIGACILDSDGVCEMLSSGIDDGIFTQPEAAAAFNAMREMYEGGLQVDLLTVVHTLRKKDCDIQRMTLFLSSCTDKVASSGHILSHCMALKELYVRREAVELGGRLVNVSEDGCDDVFEKLRHLTDDFLDKKYGGNMLHVSEVAKDSQHDFVKRIELAEQGRMSGITTGIRDLERITNGWQNSALNIIAGRPGMGKTAIAMHFALSAAKSGRSVCIYSLEMSRVKLTDRLIMALADGMDGGRFRSGNVTDCDIDAYQVGVTKLMKLPIYIDDHPLCTTGYIRATSRKMRERGNCDMVVVDYLQLTDMTTGASRQYNREQQVSKASREFKILAKELDVPVLLLSQLSRAVEGRGSKKPQLSDLRESGSIEQDADLVAFIYRPEYYGEEGYTRYDGYGNFTHGIAQVIVAKQRDGALGEVDFSYNRSLTKIWDFDGDISCAAEPPKITAPTPPRHDIGHDEDDGTDYADGYADLPY